MARGFESKDVEFQQEEATRRRTGGLHSSTAERTERARLETLRLALANARDELVVATHLSHREMLQQKVAALLSQMGSQTDPEASR